ncbi:MAG: geranylgeranyl reductase family protein [Propionibacteriaceae bacterium]|nr:geranylgeranyl reductase family protein [Propionibacteriaceae bacterium]
MSEADVIVVGAGPAGASTAAHLATHGRHVLLLDKAHFPREKVCGDGLTPRAVRELDLLGVDHSTWQRNVGLRIYAHRPYPYLLRWPDLRDFPPVGCVRRRADFDQTLADHAVARGADFRPGVTVTGPLLDDHGRVVGVTTKDGRQFHAPVTVAADGNSARLALALGLQRRASRPLGVAVRAYYTSPRHDEDWLESWLELWDGQPGRSHLLPGYGWIFPAGDGTCNVGLGLESTSPAFGHTDYRALLRRWLATTPEEWGFRDACQVGPIGSAALPMGFHRPPEYRPGLVLVGDAAGLVSPFNGEGISYALESGRHAARHIAAALAAGVGTRPAERALEAYPAALRSAWGRHFRLGNLFLELIGRPEIMKLASHYLLPLPGVAQLVHRTLANLVDDPPSNVYDRIVHLLRSLVPSA